MSITLRVLGGADIGGSCYLLEAPNARVLLDCGSYIGKPYNTHPEIPDPETVDAILISHAHMDHIGNIAYVASVCKNATIYMTRPTEFFIRHQLTETIAEYIGATTEALRYSNELLCSLVMNRCQIVGEEQSVKLKGGKIQFVFFSAGHIPGAVMIYLRMAGKTVLYSGDFSSAETELVNGYSLSDHIPTPDCLLLCAVHPAPRENESVSYESKEDELRYAEVAHHGLFINVQELTKGLEVLALLDRMKMSYTLWLDNPMWNIATSYADFSDRFTVPEFAHPLSERMRRDSRFECIFLTKETLKAVSKHADPHRPYKHFDKLACTQYGELVPNFSLHASYEEMCRFINTLGPQSTYLVHVPKETTEEQLEDLRASVSCTVVRTANGTRYTIC